MLTSTVYNMEGLSLSNESISTLNSEEDFDDVPRRDRSAGSSFLSIGSVDSQGSQHAANFDHDAATSIFDSLEQGHESANINLELTALRMSTNASEHQVRRAVAVAFNKRVSQLVNSGTAAKAAVVQVFGKHKELLERIMFDKNVSGKVDQVDFLLLLQGDLVHREKGDDILLHTSMQLYQTDVLEAEGVEQWWADPKSADTEEMRRVRAKTQPFIDFLDDDDESSEEGEDESEEDE